MRDGRAKRATSPPWRQQATPQADAAADSTSPGPADVPGGPPPRLRRWMVAAMAVAATTVAVGLVVALVTAPGQPLDLPLGTCANGVPTDGSPVPEVAVVDCSGLHDVEVFARTSLRGGGEADYPGDVAMDARAAAACQAAAVGEFGALDAGWQVKVLRPSIEGWRTGDRQVTCLLARASGSMTAGSITAQ